MPSNTSVPNSTPDLRRTAHRRLALTVDTDASDTAPVTLTVDPGGIRGRTTKHDSEHAPGHP